MKNRSAEKIMEEVMEMIDLPGRDAKREPEGWDDAGYMAFLMRAKERRRWKRVEADCGVTIIMGGITVQGRAVDISGNGVSVKTDAEVWPGVRMRLKMRLLNAEDAVETCVTGKVVWASLMDPRGAQNCFGLEFESIDEQCRGQIQGYVENGLGCMN